MMNIIDISYWQAGLNLESLFSLNPDLDGVIIKATGGTGYVNPSCDPRVQYCIEHNKPWGFYHFLDDGYGQKGGRAEADWFWKNCSNYFHHGLPFVDWEGTALKYGASYVIDFVERIHELSGVWCGIYCSQSQVNKAEFANYTQCPLWVAQYADYNKVIGFLDNPYKRGSVTPWGQETLRQYTSMGYLNGYNGHLDFNLCYISEAEWKKLAGVEEPIEAPATEEPIEETPIDTKPIEDKIAKVISMLEKIIAILKG